jgi:hypothetical protein
MASVSRKSFYKVPIIIFTHYIMGDEPIIIEQFLYGFKGVILCCCVVLWEVKTLWVRIMGVTLVNPFLPFSHHHNEKEILRQISCTHPSGTWWRHFFSYTVFSFLT